MHWDTFKDGPARRRQQPKSLYAQSKLVSIGCLIPAGRMLIASLRIRVQANVIVARELAKRYADQGILSLSVNPGMHASEEGSIDDPHGYL